jgi:hypothetical protein
MMIKIIEAHYMGNLEVSLKFSDGTEGIFDGRDFLKNQGPLLDALRVETFFSRFFIDAGALCWPNGLELSPAKLYEACLIEAASLH